MSVSELNRMSIYMPIGAAIGLGLAAIVKRVKTSSHILCQLNDFFLQFSVRRSRQTDERTNPELKLAVTLSPRS